MCVLAGSEIQWHLGNEMKFTSLYVQYCHFYFAEWYGIKNYGLPEMIVILNCFCVFVLSENLDRETKHDENCSL